MTGCSEVLYFVYLPNNDELNGRKDCARDNEIFAAIKLLQQPDKFFNTSTGVYVLLYKVFFFISGYKFLKNCKIKRSYVMWY